MGTGNHQALQTNEFVTLLSWYILGKRVQMSKEITLIEQQEVSKVCKQNKTFNLQTSLHVDRQSMLQPTVSENTTLKQD